MSSTPIGRFRAHSTRDGEALARDGEAYFAINRLSETSKPGGQQDLFEIQFADGLWMLVRLDDLVQVVPRASV
jgi:hypothetical protein